jgi:uncharacterized MAPEG superfamily protein
MLDAPLHPALVHLPLGVAMALPLVAGALAAAIWRGKLPRRAWVVVVGLQLLLLAAGAAAFAAGDREEHQVEGIVSERLVDRHQERAERFLQAAAAVLVVAAAGSMLPDRLAGGAIALGTAGTVAVAALAIRTGASGGELVYRHGAASAYTHRQGSAAEAPRLRGRTGPLRD